jgi:hypothetical protein
MAKKKVAKSAKKQAGQTDSNGSIVWFSRRLPFLAKNRGLTISERQENAIEDCKKVLSAMRGGKDWQYYDSKWERPDSESEKFKLTVWIKRRKPNNPPGPPSTAPIPATKQPPPAM